MEPIPIRLLSKKPIGQQVFRSAPKPLRETKNNLTEICTNDCFLLPCNPRGSQEVATKGFRTRSFETTPKMAPLAGTGGG